MAYNFGFAITKVSMEERLVEGVASAETWDMQDDMVLFTAIKSAFEKGAARLGIREMHQPKAVGVLRKWWTDESTKCLYVQVYLSKSRDGEDALIKVKEGVLKGFSIGGRAIDWIMEQAGRVIKELVLTEISLVDVPANPKAVITLIKLDQQEETVINSSGIDRSGGTGVLQVQKTPYPKGKENKMSDNPVISKAGVGDLLLQAKDQIEQAMEQIASNPEGAKQILSNVGAALEVATSPASSGQTNPKASQEPGGTSEISVSGESVPTIESAAASPVSPVSPVSAAASISPVPVSDVRVPSEVTAASTPGVGTMVPAEEMMATMSKLFAGAVAEAMKPLYQRLDAIEENSKVNKSAGLPVNAPAGDVPKVRVTPSSQVEDALLKGDLDTARKLAGGQSQMMDTLDLLVRKSLMSQGISVNRFFALDLQGKQQQ